MFPIGLLKTVIITVLLISRTQCSYHMWSSRYVHSPMGRMLLEQMDEEEEDVQSEIRKWYDCNMTTVDDDLKRKFVQNCKDEETMEFLINCRDKADAVFMQCGHTLFKTFSSFFLSTTTINGILGCGSMFVFSKSQFRNLLGVDQDWKGNSMIDLGAGDGKVTAMMEPLFEKVYVTEQSPSMKWRLKDRNYEILEIEEWPSQKYDLVSCLNLLDRCDTPRSVLAAIHGSLAPETGRVILAVVLPFDPCVEKGSKIVTPSERIVLQGYEFEQQVNSFSKDVLEPAGFEIVSWTRLPYLCEGDLFNTYYVLDDAVFVLKAMNKV